MAAKNILTCCHVTRLFIDSRRYGNLLIDLQNETMLLGTSLHVSNTIVTLTARGGFPFDLVQVTQVSQCHKKETLSINSIRRHFWKCLSVALLLLKVSPGLFLFFADFKKERNFPQETKYLAKKKEKAKHQREASL